jgi:uncharacterized membrane protein YgdD (TMEM256/DUF423 family)
MIGRRQRALWLALAGLNGALMVAAQAYASHRLAAWAGEANVALFRTAGQYQMWHGLALAGLALGTAGLPRGGPTRAVQAAAWLFIVGILCFCGALYGLGLTGPAWLTNVAPFGGTAFIVGWAALFAAGVLWGLRRTER